MAHYNTAHSMAFRVRHSLNQRDSEVRFIKSLTKDFFEVELQKEDI